MTIYHESSALPKLTHFTPMSKAHWCWCFVWPVLTLTGHQKMIDGTWVDIGSGVTAWEGRSKVAPKFATREDAVAWADANNFQYQYCDLY